MERIEVRKERRVAMVLKLVDSNERLEIPGLNFSPMTIQQGTVGELGIQVARLNIKLDTLVFEFFGNTWFVKRTRLPEELNPTLWLLVRFGFSDWLSGNSLMMAHLRQSGKLLAHTYFEDHETDGTEGLVLLDLKGTNLSKALVVTQGLSVFWEDNRRISLTGAKALYRP